MHQHVFKGGPVLGFGGPAELHKLFQSPRAGGRDREGQLPNPYPIYNGLVAKSLQRRATGSVGTEEMTDM